MFSIASVHFRRFAEIPSRCQRHCWRRFERGAWCRLFWRFGLCFFSFGFVLPLLSNQNFTDWSISLTLCSDLDSIERKRSSPSSMFRRKFVSLQNSTITVWRKEKEGWFFFNARGNSWQRSSRKSFVGSCVCVKSSQRKSQRLHCAWCVSKRFVHDLVLLFFFFFFL